MRKTALSALGLVAVLALPAAAAGTPGPFAGHVSQGGTQAHSYDNNPANQPCIHLMTSYTVVLSYAPPTDVLTLSVGAASATGRNGTAALTVGGSWCTRFGIAVTGTSVTAQAAYVVTVTRNGAGGGGTVAR